MGWGWRTMTACWNSEVSYERRSLRVRRHGPPEPARGPFPKLAGLGPSASTGDAVTTRAHVKAQLPLGALGQRQGKSMAAKSSLLISLTQLTINSSKE